VESPKWLTGAMASDEKAAQVEVDGAQIAYSVWGDTSNPGMILIHGSNAHRHWWQWVAPYLARRFRVAAIDLSGHGDSEWREAYSGETFAKEVMAVCSDANLGEKPIVVAHSFGGFVGLETAHHYGDQLRGVVFADFTVAPRAQYVEWGNQRAERGGPARPTRIYEDRDVALGRYRLIPEQPNRYPEVLAFLAEKSLRAVNGGWTWKFDPALFDDLEMGIDQTDKFEALRCPSALILGEHSTDEGAYFAEHMIAVAPYSLPSITLYETHHHFMLEEPMATVSAIEALVAPWL